MNLNRVLNLLCLVVVLFCSEAVILSADETVGSLPPLVVEAVGDDVSEEEKPEESSVEKEDGIAGPLDAEISELKKQKELLAAKNALRSERLKSELGELKDEKDRLSLENSLVKERMQAELAAAKAELERIDLESDKIRKEMGLEAARMRQRVDVDLLSVKEEEAHLKALNALAEAKVQSELSDLRLVEARMKKERAELEMQVASLHARIVVREKEETLKDQIDFEDEAMYVLDPYEDGVLRISDRRISLNGVIWGVSAEFVSERINFYNNQSSEYPIFLVIDSSPGGSVMAGYQILKAMQGSEAPVYVIVKSYAASMAAVIATTAERSYAYENAVILHHQLGWYGVTGNLTQQREYADEAQEWWRRLAKPVAKKMGLSLEEFIAMMYEKNSNGDWSEFADVAKQYGWIDEVVDRVWETSVVRNPDRFDAGFFVRYQLEEHLDEDGRSFVELPRLEPFDFYFLYDRSDYYRLR